MENLAISRLLAEIADLLELKGQNPFRIRAYRNAAAAVADLPERAVDLDAARLLAIPGIGKDLAAKIREVVETGRIAYHDELLREFPPTLLDLLRLQGVGPKTAALLYQTAGIASLDDLEGAARAGRLRTIRGMGARKEALLLKALEERKRFAGRHLLADADEVARGIIADLQVRVPGAALEPVGSLRRGTETCGDLDFLCAGGDAAVLDAFTTYPLVERVLAHGDTKASVLVHDGYQADLRVVARDSRGAALQYFTGSKTHNVALRDRAIARGFKLNEYGLFRLADDVRVAGETEEGIYEALGLAWIPPELREQRGEIEAAAAGRLPRLIERTDLRGDLHTHTTATDGKDDVATMLRAAAAEGLEYVAFTDHSHALAMANGLDEPRALAHAAEIRRVGEQFEGVRALAGIECDILPDGTLDLADDCLAQLDIVVAAIHSAFNQSESEMTDRLLRAIENPWVDVIGHPTGRLLLRRPPRAMDFERVLEACVRNSVALEINCQIDRLDLGDVNARFAADRGVPLVISTDAHAARGFAAARWGIVMARRAWLTPEHVLNTRRFDAFRGALRRHRRAAVSRA
jgi:DNA polymerase (family 10)